MRTQTTPSTDCHSYRDQLIASQVDEHVVRLDPVTCRSLILRQVNAMDITLRGEVLLSIGSSPSVAISTLLTRPDLTAGVPLKTLLMTRQSEATVQV